MVELISIKIVEPNKNLRYMRCDIYHSITYNGGDLNMQREEKDLYITMSPKWKFNVFKQYLMTLENVVEKNFM